MSRHRTCPIEVEYRGYRGRAVAIATAAPGPMLVVGFIDDGGGGIRRFAVPAVDADPICACKRVVAELPQIIDDLLLAVQRDRRYGRLRS